MRRASRTDTNHRAIVAALHSIGASVHSLAAVGCGCPDLLIGYRGRTILIEVKDGERVPSARRLTPDQIDWHAKWRGGGLYVVDSVSAAIDVCTNDGQK